MSNADFIINGLNLNDGDELTITQCLGLGGLDQRVSSEFVAGGDGSVIYATRDQSRVIRLQGQITTQTPERFFELRRLVNNAFARTPLRKSLVINTWDGLSFTATAVVIQPFQPGDEAGNVTTVPYTAVLECEDGKFGDGVSQQFTAVPVGGMMGFPLPAPLPMPLGLAVGNTTIVINNTGDVPVIPKFRIDGEIEGAVVTNMTTGRSFSIINTIPDNRFVEIFRQGGDTFVLLDGITPWYQNFIGEPFVIELGNNTIRITATTSGANALLTIDYQNQRNGL